MSKPQHQSALSRRAFLVGLAGAAVTFGFAPGEGTAEEPGSSPFEPTIWYSVDRDGIVTVNITRAEMGQHIGTAVARILADELEVDWSNVRISAVDTDPKWGVMMHGRQQFGVARFPGLQPRRRRGPDRSHRGRRQAARREPVAMLRAPGRRVRRKSIHLLRRDRQARRADAQIYAGRTRAVADQAGLGAASHREKDRCAGHPGEDQRHGALRHRCGRRGHGLCPAKDSPDAQRFGGPRGRRFRGEAGQGISHEPRARGPLQYGARMGRRVRDVLSGGDPCRRPRQGRLGRGRRRPGVRAGHPRLRREANRRTKRRRALGGRPGHRFRLSRRRVHARADVHHRPASFMLSSNR